MKSKEILLVFPNNINAQFFKCAMGKIGHISHVKTWTEAHYLQKEKRFDAVFTEIGEVGMYDYPECLSSLVKESGCPVIVLTSQHFQDEERKCREAGAKDFILLGSSRATSINALKQIIDEL